MNTRPVTEWLERVLKSVLLKNFCWYDTNTDFNIDLCGVYLLAGDLSTIINPFIQLDSGLFVICPERNWICTSVFLSRLVDMSPPITSLRTNGRKISVLPKIRTPLNHQLRRRLQWICINNSLVELIAAFISSFFYPCTHSCPYSAFIILIVPTYYICTCVHLFYYLFTAALLPFFPSLSCDLSLPLSHSLFFLKHFTLCRITSLTLYPFNFFSLSHL